MTDSNPTALHGVIPPIMTPLDAHGDLDLASLDRLITFLLESGVDGLFVLGSSGEAAYLTDQQRCLVVDRVIGQVAGQIAVLVGLVDTMPARVVEHGRQLLKPGVRAAVVTAPFYANLARRGGRRPFCRRRRFPGRSDPGLQHPAQRAPGT
jgi:4-hydroxy-tetrahydrodipicolinate synthase